MAFGQKGLSAGTEYAIPRRLLIYYWHPRGVVSPESGKPITWVRSER